MFPTFDTPLKGGLPLVVVALPRSNYLIISLVLSVMFVISADFCQFAEFLQPPRALRVDSEYHQKLHSVLSLF